MQKYWKELLISVLCFMGLAVYMLFQIDWNKPKSKHIFSVQVGQQTIPVMGVKIVQIPPEVYEGMDRNPAWKEHLLGNKKHVFLTVWTGCPYQRAFRSEFDKVFVNPFFPIFYTKNIVETGQTVSGRCESKNCPQIWLINNCVQGWCIINPLTKEAITVHSRNASQIAPILTAYATWNNTPLLEEK